MAEVTVTPQTGKKVKKPRVKEKKPPFFKTLVKQRELVLIALPFFVYVFIFCYYPLSGLVMAFQNFRPKPGLGLLDHEWVGLDQFKKLFTDDAFIRIFRNTVAMGGINLVLSFITAIAFALLLNELRVSIFKRTVQTISYLPHFLSWIIVTGLVANVLAVEDGIINSFLDLIGLEKVHFLAEPNYFWWIVGFSHVWKGMGWNSIIYLAAMSAIDPGLYEAAEIDGANRFQRALYITLPGIKATTIVLLILNVGWILNAGFEVQFLLGNGIVSDVAETIDIFVIRRGLALNNFSLATAAGMFKGLVSVILIGICNFIAGRLGEEQVV
ncbi:MAG: ABC transporter permease subunit [Oscillospiraceae bacterium]|jgi:putative aldouronate transport system permease protein|nr:ABC transporter permease subunit [Oscillospiraceae bacterium]